MATNATIGCVAPPPPPGSLQSADPRIAAEEARSKKLLAKYRLPHPVARSHYPIPEEQSLIRVTMQNVTLCSLGGLQHECPELLYRVVPKEVAIQPSNCQLYIAECAAQKVPVHIAVLDQLSITAGRANMFVLNCAGLSLGDEGVAALLPVIRRNTGVRCLSFRHCNIGNVSVLRLLHALDDAMCCMLETIDLSCNTRIGDAVVDELVAFINARPVLQRVTLQLCGITKHRAEAVAMAVHRNRLGDRARDPPSPRSPRQDSSGSDGEWTAASRAHRRGDSKPRANESTSMPGEAQRGHSHLQFDAQSPGAEGAADEASEELYAAPDEALREKRHDGDAKPQREQPPAQQQRPSQARRGEKRGTAVVSFVSDSALGGSSATEALGNGSFKPSRKASLSGRRSSVAANPAARPSLFATVPLMTSLKSISDEEGEGEAEVGAATPPKEPVVVKPKPPKRVSLVSPVAIGGGAGSPRTPSLFSSAPPELAERSRLSPTAASDSIGFVPTPPRGSTSAGRDRRRSTAAASAGGFSTMDRRRRAVSPPSRSMKVGDSPFVLNKAQFVSALETFTRVMNRTTCCIDMQTFHDELPHSYNLARRKIANRDPPVESISFVVFLEATFPSFSRAKLLESVAQYSEWALVQHVGGRSNVNRLRMDQRVEMEKMFEQLDKDHDGIVTIDQLHTILSEAGRDAADFVLGKLNAPHLDLATFMSLTAPYLMEAKKRKRWR